MELPGTRGTVGRSGGDRGSGNVRERRDDKNSADPRQQESAAGKETGIPVAEIAETDVPTISAPGIPVEIATLETAARRYFFTTLV